MTKGLWPWGVRRCYDSFWPIFPRGLGGQFSLKFLTIKKFLSNLPFWLCLMLPFCETLAEIFVYYIFQLVKSPRLLKIRLYFNKFIIGKKLKMENKSLLILFLWLFLEITIFFIFLLDWMVNPMIVKAKPWQLVSRAMIGDIYHNVTLV